jgi:hypothetical protein
MQALRIRTKIDSAYLSSIPQLDALIGKDVEIIVIEEPIAEMLEAKPSSTPPAAQPFDARKACSGGPEGMGDGFEEALTRWRREEQVAELPE